MKTFEFNNEAITIEKTGYGQYVFKRFGYISALYGL